jgi:hypothetical protein
MYRLRGTVRLFATPHPAVADRPFQDELLDELARLTRTRLV